MGEKERKKKKKKVFCSFGLLDFKGELRIHKPLQLAQKAVYTLMN